MSVSLTRLGPELDVFNSHCNQLVGFKWIPLNDKYLILMTPEKEKNVYLANNFYM